VSIFKRQFWKAAVERATKALAWSAGSTLISAGTGLIDSDWVGVCSTAGMVFVLSMLGSVASDKVTGGTGPSLTNAERLPGR
jgi:Putative lactococcus lactis phage r1t holin